MHRTRLAALLLSIGLAAAAQAAEPTLPDLDPLLEAYGKRLVWSVDDQDRTVMAPTSSVVERATGNVVVPFPLGEVGDKRVKRISAVDLLLIGGPLAMGSLVLTGGRDLASCGDLELYARRFAWDVGDAALAQRLDGAAGSRREQVERLIALRLLQRRTTGAARDAVKRAPGAMPEVSTLLPEPVAAEGDLVGLRVHQGLVAVLRPARYPGIGGGAGSSRALNALGAIAKLTRKKGGIDPEMLAANAWECDAAGLWPIEFAIRYGNLRIDRAVVSMAADDLASSAPPMTVDLAGVGLEAVRRFLAASGMKSDPRSPGALAGGGWLVTGDDARLHIAHGDEPAEGAATLADADEGAALWMRAKVPDRLPGELRGPASFLGLAAGDVACASLRFDTPARETRLALSLPRSAEPAARAAAAALASAIAALGAAPESPERIVSLAPLLPRLGIGEPTVSVGDAGAVIALALAGAPLADLLPLSAADADAMAPGWRESSQELARTIAAARNGPAQAGP